MDSADEERDSSTVRILIEEIIADVDDQKKEIVCCLTRIATEAQAAPIGDDNGSVVKAVVRLGDALIGSGEEVSTSAGYFI